MSLLEEDDTRQKVCPEITEYFYVALINLIKGKIV